MRMTRDDDLEPRRCRVEIQLGQVVNDVDNRVAYLQHFGFADGRRPGTVVVVSPHRGDRRNFSKRSENVRVADVARVDDIVAAPQRLDRLGPQESMSVGDKTNFQRAPSYSEITSLGRACDSQKKQYFYQIHDSA